MTDALLAAERSLRQTLTDAEADEVIAVMRGWKVLAETVPDIRALEADLARVTAALDEARAEVGEMRARSTSLGDLCEDAANAAHCDEDFAFRVLGWLAAEVAHQRERRARAEAQVATLRYGLIRAREHLVGASAMPHTLRDADAVLADLDDGGRGEV